MLFRSIPLKGTEGELEDLRLENLELKHQLKQQQILFDSKKYSLDCQNEALIQEINKYGAKVQLLEKQNFQLVKFYDKGNKNLKISRKYTHKDQEAQCAERPKAISISVQTTEENKKKIIQKLKDEIKSQFLLISKYEGERIDRKSVV